MKNEDLLDRTKRFAIWVLKFIEMVRYSPANKHICGQLIRCSTSVAANYRAARRGKSRADFLYKIKIVEEEADESVFWLEMLTEINPTNLEGSEDLLQEARELTAIFSASSKTPKAKT